MADQDEELVVPYSLMRALANMPEAVSDESLCEHLKDGIAEVERRIGRTLESEDDEAGLLRAAALYGLAYAVPFIGIIYAASMDRAARMADDMSDMMMAAADRSRLIYLQDQFRTRADALMAAWEKAQEEETDEEESEEDGNACLLIV